MSFNFQQKRLLSQCAESDVYECDFYGTAAIIKERPVKPYRHPMLDQKMRTQRTLREARALAKCKRMGVSCPDVYAVDKEKCTIVMERLQGMTVREAIQRITDGDIRTFGVSKQVAHSANLLGPQSVVTKNILHHVGRVVGALHRADKIHGDLTTSNFILRVDPLSHPVLLSTNSFDDQAHAQGMKRQRDKTEDDKEFDMFFRNSDIIMNASSSASTETLSQNRDEELVSVIDFGLVKESLSAEEGAVDLYVLERALLSTHPLVEQAFECFQSGYLAVLANSTAASVDRGDQQNQGIGKNEFSHKGVETMKRLEAVRARGRKRSMIG